MRARVSKGLVAALATILAMGSLAACGGDDDDSKKSDTGAAKASKPVTITWMTFETPNLPAAFWEDVKTRFERENPNIKVKRIVTPTLDRDAYAKQLLASGQFPDVLQGITPQDYVKAGQLEPFTPEEVKSWNTTSPDAGLLEGKQFSIPNVAQIIPLIYYNKDAFDKLGLKEPKTWAEFLDICKKVKASGETPLLIGGSKDTWASWLFAGGIFSTDVLGKDPDWIVKRQDEKVHFADDPLVTKAIEKWADLAKAGYFNKNALSLDYTHLQEAFLKKKGVMYPMGSWASAKTAVGGAKFKVGVFRIPTDDGSVVEPDFAAGGVFVNAKSKNVEAAKKLATFWSLDPKTLSALAENDGGIITVKGFKPPEGLPDVYYETLDMWNEKGDVKRVDVMFSNRGDRASVAGSDNFYGHAVQKIFLGKSVEDQLKAIDTAWDRAARH
jgi:raffinose/stachyose/melibiose transport system substrate-binding protein